MEETETVRVTPQVWIADLAAYNEGHLHGKWVDATDADEMHEAAKQIIATSPALLPEEYLIHDYNDFPRAVVSALGETSDFESVARIGRLLEEHGDRFRAYLEACDYSDITDAEIEAQFEARSIGSAKSEEDWAREEVEQIGWHNVPPAIPVEYHQDRTIQIFEELSSYIDWESIAQELFQHGEYKFQNGYIFDWSRV